MRRFLLLIALLPLSIAWGCERNSGEPSTTSQSPEVPVPAAGSGAAEPARSLRKTRDEWFQDITSRVRLTHRYRNGQEGNQFTLLETVGGGVAMIDFDNDGDLDLFFTGGGAIIAGDPNRVEGRAGALYRNDGNWKFTDVTEPAGLSDSSLYTHGATVLDFNRDGWQDLFVTGYGGCRLFRNERGEKFAEIGAEAGIVVSGWATAAAAADFDRDGWPDLYVACYCQWRPEDENGLFCGDRERDIRDCCNPQLFPPAQHRLFRNLGHGRFEDVTEQAALSDQGRGLGVVAADLNDDGWIDFYVANDAGANHLYLNLGKLPWREQGLAAGVAYDEYGLPEGSMGVDLADPNGDGRPDLFVTNFELENNSLYQNEGEGTFRHATVAAGLAGECFPYVGFGTGFGDFNGDGWEDLYIINGSVFYRTGQSPYRQPSFLYENRAGRFHNASEAGGRYFAENHAGRGAALGDLDNDGALDLVIVRQNDPPAVLRGLFVPKVWRRVSLRGVKSDPLAVGAKVTATCHGRTITRWVRSGAGYLSQSDLRIVLPCDAADNRSVQVHWPGGLVERFDDLGDFQLNELIEGKGIAAPSPSGNSTGSQSRGE